MYRDPLRMICRAVRAAAAVARPTTSGVVYREERSQQNKQRTGWGKRGRGGLPGSGVPRARDGARGSAVLGAGGLPARAGPPRGGP